MEARSVDAIPRGGEWQYEPKWDGFRCLLARDGEKVDLRSKSGENLGRYFPELIAAALKLKATSFVLDGEIVVPHGKMFSFDDLLQRIHPAVSRIKKLAQETPALFIAFDLLANAADKKLSAELLSRRRPKLEAFARVQLRSNPAFRLSPVTTSYATAMKWLKQSGGGFDGVIAKRIDLPYQAGNRDGMQKVKKFRSADCVVGGFRYATNKINGRNVIGSLLLGLYDDDDLLHHVGFTSAIKREDKPALTAKLEALIAKPGFTGNAPGGPSRWSTDRSAQWCPLKPKLVIEVCYDHFSGERFRHGTSILRWRPDKAPRQCTFEQLKQKAVDPMKLLKV
ncbi:ATP-dependent DNA ligase [Bradyrhizobium cenepequi]|uniref:ATP-dependent DNA ligase n=1 Tax=Bradyrhizobium cenepequi TaxID=2821403 RepID=UPI001CE28173|nr:ATP-dependent DNA ligase [Bradyrhizobium cenepequi]MCA6107590.1 ATP-dependent DNA ligase [Bradyrhizobium cenepequi]